MTTALEAPADDGLATLDEAQLDLMRSLDRALRDLARGAGAREIGYPALVDVGSLDAIDYFRNFPHLGLAVAPLRPEVLQDFAQGRRRPQRTLDADDIAPARYLLPSAACYPVYRQLRGQALAQPACVTTLQRCFRNEASFDGLARLLGFSMREVVFVGAPDAVNERLAEWRRRVTEIADACGVPVAIETASDPFFESGGSRARMQQLFPVKEEFVFDGTVAVASVNRHRNFFAERWNIRLDNGELAHSGCVAFGLERWLHALGRCHDGDPQRMRSALRRIAPTAHRQAEERP